MSGGRRRAEVERDPHRWLRALLPLAGALVAGLGWAALVVVAVRLGRHAQGAATWVPVVAATVGAIGCLLLVLSQLARTRAVVQGTVPARRPRGRRRL